MGRSSHMDVLFALFLLMQSLMQSDQDTAGSTQIGMIRSMLADSLRPDGAAGENAQGGGQAGQPEDGRGQTADPQPDAPKIKGIYVTAYSAGGARMRELLDLVDRTELNAMVIDIKDDRGYITYKTDNPELAKYESSQSYIKDIGKLMETLREHDVYPIARIVVFKDSVLAKKRPDLSFLNPDGSIWQNRNKDHFVNPYMKEVW